MQFMRILQQFTAGAGGGFLLGCRYCYRGVAALLHGPGGAAVGRGPGRGDGGAPAAAGEGGVGSTLQVENVLLTGLSLLTVLRPQVRPCQALRAAAGGAGRLLRHPGLRFHPQPGNTESQGPM